MSERDDKLISSTRYIEVVLHVVPPRLRAEGASYDRRGTKHTANLTAADNLFQFLHCWCSSSLNSNGCVNATLIGEPRKLFHFGLSRRKWPFHNDFLLV